MANTEKLFSVAGTATNPDGTTKARFANDLVSRVKILQKHGCTDINLMELPTPMTKIQALEYLQSQGITEGAAGEAVATKLSEKSTVAKRSQVKVSAKSTRGNTTKKAPTMESIKAKAAKKAAVVVEESTPAEPVA